MAGFQGRCLASGMDFMLGKPFSKNELIATLSAWLTRAGACALHYVT